MERGGLNNPLLDYGFPDGSGNPTSPAKYAAGLQASWEGQADAAWVSTGVNTFRWRWRSEILDLHPRFRSSTDLGSELQAVPINRDAALGSGTYMHVLVYVNGAVNVPLIGGLSCTAYECGNDQAPRIAFAAPATPQVAPLFLLARPSDVTSMLREGGVDTVLDGLAYRGGSLLQFSPPSENIRFWQVWLEFNYDSTLAVNPNIYGLAIQASVY